MSKSPAERAKEIVESASVIGGSTGWIGKVGRYTKDPNQQVVFTDYSIPGENPNPAFLLDFVRVNVIVRGNIDAYGEAFDKAREIKDRLLGMEATTHNNDDHWSGVTMIGDIGFIGYDESNRPMFSSNFRILQEPAADLLSNRESL